MQTKTQKRVNIEKSKGKKRPLGIHTMQDRAMQALYLMALEPVTETMADPHTHKGGHSTGWNYFANARQSNLDGMETLVN